MSYKKIKKIYRIQNDCFNCCATIRVLLRVLEERNYDNYPVNYLLTILLRDEKSAAKKLFETTNILGKYFCIKR